MKIRDQSVVYSYAITLCMGSFVFGYELTSYGNLSALIEQRNQLSAEETARMMTRFNIIFGCFNLVGIVFYQYFKRFGWLLLFRITDWLTILASIIGMLSLSLQTQIISRALFGFVTGINTILIPTFLTSILPGPMGAPAGTLNQFFIVLGFLVGFWVGYLVLPHGCLLLDQQEFITCLSSSPGISFWWRVIIGIPIVAALIRNHFLHTYFPYEALQDLVQTQQFEILQHYLDTIYINTTIEEYKEAKRLTSQDINEESAPFFLDQSKFYKIRFSIAMGIVALNQLSGGTAFAFFGSNVSFSAQGNTSRDKLTIFVTLQVLHLCVTLLAGQNIQKYGRRAFMQEGQKIIIISLFLTAFVQTFTQYHLLTLILSFVQIVGFGLCYGPCTFLIGTQVINDIYYPALLQWLMITVNFIIVEPLVKFIGMGPVCLIYGLIQVAGYFFFQSYQIQTQGKLRRDVYSQFRTGTYPKHTKTNKNKPTSQQMSLLHQEINEK